MYVILLLDPFLVQKGDDMIFDYMCTNSNTFHKIVNNIDLIKDYLATQKELIDKDIRLSLCTKPTDSHCSLILYAPFRVTLKANPKILLQNTLKQVGIEEVTRINEVTLDDLSIYQLAQNAVFYLDSLDEIVSNETETFINKSMIDPIQEYDLTINDEYLDLLSDELSRIREYSKDHFTGNPCHYIFTSDSVDAINASNYLVNSLVQSNRLHSSKIREIEFGFGFFGQQFKYKFADTITHCLGHVVRIIFNDEFIRESHQTRHNALHKLTNMIEEYSNTVLFIVHFNDQLYEKSRTFLKKNVSNLYVEFSRNDLSVEEAKQYIHVEAYKYGVEPYEVIDEMISLSTKKTYSKTEIRNQLISSSKNKLNQPQFESYLTLKRNMMNSVEQLQVDKMMKKPVSAIEQLERLIGLQNVKELIRNMVAMNKLKPLLHEKGISIGHPSMHCCFMGHPGTAKTTVARLLAQIMKEEGILKTGVFIEVTRKDLVGEYVGQTAPKVKEVFNKASGGVLFIDEAYSLYDGYGRKSYGDEAIATLVELMENHRHKTIVIMAGYPNEMNEFLDVNPGLKSRIPHVIQFDNYSVKEMMDIAKHIANQMGFEFEEKALKLLSKYFMSELMKSSFANGRTVRNLVEKIIQTHVIQVYEENDNPTKTQIITIDSKSVELLENNSNDRIDQTIYQMS